MKMMSSTTIDREDRPRIPAICRQDGGFVAQGPGFYIWDESPKEVLEAVCKLFTGRGGSSTTARFMVIAEDAVGVD